MHLQEAALRQHRPAQQTSSHPTSRRVAEQAAAGNLPCQPLGTRLPPVRKHPSMRQQQRCHAGQDRSTGPVDCSPTSSVGAATVNQGRETHVATDATHGFPDANEWLTACSARASKSKSSGSATNQSEADSAGLSTAEAVDVAKTSKTDTKGGCLHEDRPTDSSSASSLQHNRPGTLVISQPRLEPEHAAPWLQGKHHQAAPSTPGTQQGPLQEQPCTPGLVSSNSACCVLPRSCSSNGGDSSGSGLEAENSIRFRKRSKFEALKARREECRQKAEVANSDTVFPHRLCCCYKCKHIVHGIEHPSLLAGGPSSLEQDHSGLLLTLVDQNNQNRHILSWCPV